MKDWIKYLVSSGGSRGGGPGMHPTLLSRSRPPLRSRRLAPPLQSRLALPPLRPQPRITKTKHALRNRTYSAFQGSYWQRACARLMLKYCCFRQRSSVDLVSISYSIEQSFKQHKHNDSPGICHCPYNSQDPRAGSRGWSGSWVLQDLSGDWTSRPDESDYIWVCLICLIYYNFTKSPASPREAVKL